MIQNFHKYFIRSITALLLLSNLNSYSAIDYLDTTFGTNANGKVITPIGTFAQANGLAINASGKIVAAGTATLSGAQNIIVAEYNSDGTLNTSFATSGIFNTSAGSANAFGTAVNVDASGNILVGGNDDSGNVVLIRLTSAGALDSTFGTGGVATLSLGSGNGGNASAIVIDANNKILVAGTAAISGTQYLYVARFNTDGTIDTTFNTTGYNAITGSSNYVGTSIAIDQNAKIIAGGSAAGISGTDFLLARFNSTDGSLDTSFGTSGTVITPISSTTNDQIQSIAIDSSNRIVVAGFTLDTNNNSSFVVARYSNAGALDTTFGAGSTGIVIQSIGVSAIAYSVLIDQSGNIVVGGNSDTNFALARFASNGSLDTTFGIGGIYTTLVGQFNSGSLAAAIQSSDGRVVQAGFSTTDESTGDTAFALVRYNKNNTDFVNITSIADNGTITTKIPSVSGTSNGTTSPQATVQVVVNGVVLTTVNTDGSGNWTAGNTNVLPIGANTIQANLIISGVTVVSHVTKFTVADNLSEDAVFAYNSTSQTANANSSFASLPFDNILIGTSSSPVIGTWSYASNVFTCNKSGRYLIEYVGHAGATAVGVLTTSINVATGIFLNSTEYVGSEANTNLDLTAGITRIVSKTFIKDLNVGDTLSLDFAISRVGGTGTVTGGLLTNSNSTGTQNAYSMAITRIG
jgi:uncharacterized delta-60 repeat protein